MRGVEEMSAILQADTNVTSQIDTFNDGVGTYPAIWHDLMIPRDFGGTKTINFYENEPVNHTLNYGRYSFTYNCRGETMKEARNIREAVKDALNRAGDSTGDFFFICESSLVLKPADERDNYNAILNVVVRER